MSGFVWMTVCFADGEGRVPQLSCYFACLPCLSTCKHWNRRIALEVKARYAPIFSDFKLGRPLLFRNPGIGQDDSYLHERIPCQELFEDVVPRAPQSMPVYVQSASIRLFSYLLSCQVQLIESILDRDIFHGGKHFFKSVYPV